MHSGQAMPMLPLVMMLMGIDQGYYDEYCDSSCCCSVGSSWVFFFSDGSIGVFVTRSTGHKVSLAAPPSPLQRGRHDPLPQPLVH